MWVLTFNIPFILNFDLIISSLSDIDGFIIEPTKKFWNSYDDEFWIICATTWSSFSNMFLQIKHFFKSESVDFILNFLPKFLLGFKHNFFDINLPRQ